MKKMTSLLLSIGIIFSCLPCCANADETREKNVITVEPYIDISKSLNYTEETRRAMYNALGIKYDSDGTITDLNGKSGYNSLDNGEALGKIVFEKLHIRSQYGSEKSGDTKWTTKNGIAVYGAKDIKMRSQIKFHPEATVDQENSELNPDYPEKFSRYVFEGGNFIYDLNNEDGSFKPSKVVVRYFSWIGPTNTTYPSTVTTNRGYTNVGGTLPNAPVLDSTFDKPGTLTVSIKKDAEYDATRPYKYTNANGETKYDWDAYELTLTGFTNEDRYIAFQGTAKYIYAIDVYYMEETSLEYNVTTSTVKDEARSLNYTEETRRAMYDKLGIKYNSDGTITDLNDKSGYSSLDNGEALGKIVFEKLHIRSQYGSEESGDNKWTTKNGIAVYGAKDIKMRSQIKFHPEATVDQENSELNPDYPEKFSRYVFEGGNFIYDLNNEDGSFKPSKVVVRYFSWIGPTNTTYPSTVTTNRGYTNVGGTLPNAPVLDSTFDKPGTLTVSIKKDAEYDATRPYKYTNANGETKYDWDAYELTLTGFTNEDRYIAFQGTAKYIYAIDVYYDEVSYNISGLSGQNYDYLKSFICYPSESVCNVAKTDEAFKAFLTDNNISTKTDADAYNANHSDAPIVFTKNQLILNSISISEPATIGLDISNTGFSVISDYTGSDVVCVVVGAYDTNSDLIKALVYKDVPLSGYDKDFGASDLPADYKLLKVFLLNDLNSIEPVCQSDDYTPVN